MTTTSLKRHLPKIYLGNKLETKLVVYFVQLLLCLLSFSSIGTAFAYEINPSRTGVAYDPVHESLTANALYCLQGSNGIIPTKCIQPIVKCLRERGDIDDNRKDCFLRNIPSEKYSKSFTSGELQTAVGWPDDPTREISLLSGAKYGYKMLKGCEYILLDLEGLDIKNGLLCNSHFGRLQFWHAQAESIHEKAEVTRQRILDWAKFNFRVATMQIDADEKYCAHFIQHRSSISDILYPADYPYCEERLFWGWVPKWLVTPHPPYRIATFYGLTCSDMFFSRTCTEKLINYKEKNKRMTRITATGALIHLVQDTYSQSHVQRGWCGDGPSEMPVSKIECTPIEKYTNYAFYDKKTNSIIAQTGHDKSDKWPAISQLCNGENDDPITASAKILWLINQALESDDKKEMIQKFDEYIEEFFNEVGEGVSSGSGMCYASKVVIRPPSTTDEDEFWD